MERLLKKMYPILQRVHKLPKILLYNIFKHTLRCRERRILLASNRKNELEGNLLYIYNELKKHDYDIHIVMYNVSTWREKMKFNWALLYYTATSKYILIDDFFPIMYSLKIREGSKFVQVWHALGAYKKVGYSRKDIGNANSLSHKNYTDVIVSSEAIVGNYAEAFGISEDKVHALGIPRTDLFFNSEAMEKARNNVYKEHPELRSKRLILFAPTFRGSGKKSAHYPEEYIDLSVIYESLKENDVFIIKIHPFIRDALRIEEQYEDKIVDLTDYPDINELLLVTDLLITDYSSVIFEYVFVLKPVIFYVPDLEEYSGERSFYYDYREYMYGSVAKNQQELTYYMQNAVIDEEKAEIFKEKFCSKCDGNASRRFVEELILK